MRTLTLDYVVGALKTLLTHLCFKGFRCKWRRVWSVVSDGCSKLTNFDNWTCKRFNLPVPRAAYVVEIGDIYRNPWCATKSISQYIHWTPWLWTFSNPFAILSWLISSLLSNYEAKKRQRVVVSRSLVPLYMMPFYDLPTRTQDFWLLHA